MVAVNKASCEGKVVVTIVLTTDEADKLSLMMVHAMETDAVSTSMFHKLASSIDSGIKRARKSTRGVK